MELLKIGVVAVLASGFAACTGHRNPAFVYPPAVVAAHEQAHYRTALWCTYTSLLDSSVFRKEPMNDSLAATLRGWLAVRRKLERIEQDSLTTCFRFKLAGPNSTILRLYDNSYHYENTAFGLPVTIAVWVNRKDGLIDSVLDCYNRRRSAGFPVSFIAGRWQRTGPTDRKLFSYNLDQPCKAAFLQANSPKLRWDVRLLCIEKDILPR